MVYPALTFLEEIGHATIEADGNRKRYHITEAGQQYLAEHRVRADALFAQFTRVGERMERVRRAMGAGMADDETISDSASSGSKELRHAVHELRRAMGEKWSSRGTSSCVSRGFSSTRPRTFSARSRAADALEGAGSRDYSILLLPRPLELRCARDTVNV